MEDFYDEILGMSIKEMALSENVSIPDTNKRRLWNIESLTNKRWQSDIQIEGNSSEIPNIPQTEKPVKNFYSERALAMDNIIMNHREEPKFTVKNKSNPYDAICNQFNTPTDSHHSRYKTRRTYKNMYNYEPRNSNYVVNKSIDLSSKYDILSADRNRFDNDSHK